MNGEVSNLEHFKSEFYKKQRRINELAPWFDEKDKDFFSRVRDMLKTPMSDTPEWRFSKLLDTLEVHISNAYSRKLQHYLKDVEYDYDWVKKQYAGNSSIPMECVMWIDVLHDWTDKLYKQTEGALSHKQIFELAKQCESHHHLEQRLLGSEAMSTSSKASMFVERVVGKTKKAEFKTLNILLEYQENQYKHIEFSGDNVHDFLLECTKVLNCPHGSFDLQIYASKDILIDLDEVSFADLEDRAILKVLYHKQLLLSDIKIIESIGSGNYGEVYKGYWMSSLVALKKLNETNADELYEEAKMLQDMKHVNIVRFFGLYRECSDVYMVMELCGTSLDNFLVENKDELKLENLYDMIITLSSALKYLTEWQFIHRDLAARNVLVSVVDGNPIVKLADFGRAKRTHYFIPTVNIVPTAWSSPEVLQGLGYSEFSDVYSFGVLMWEILSFGEEPYGNCDFAKTKSMILEGKVLSRPMICPLDFYNEVLLKCWAQETTKRPSFETLYNLLSSVIVRRTNEGSTKRKPKKPKYGSEM